MAPHLLGDRQPQPAEACVDALVADDDQLGADACGHGADRAGRRARLGVQPDLDVDVAERLARGLEIRRTASGGSASPGGNPLTTWSTTLDEAASSAACFSAAVADSEPSVPVTIAPWLIRAADGIRFAGGASKGGCQRRDDLRDPLSEAVALGRRLKAVSSNA